ncbi:MAG: glycine cleavage system protein T, partial [Proteobacteria bacterium]|nr:glycine cleavage system protein T [Pseudomonadota bacterium]
GTKASIAGVRGFVSRTGYTGEDGCEWIVAAEDAQDVWTKILQAGESFGVTAAGLACRDTLRLEAGMPLYGHELTEEISPVQAGLCFACNVENRDFLGRQAIISDRQNPQLPQRIGLEIFGKRVPRQHYPILLGDQTVGEITSGTFSPTFNKPIAMGYVQSDCAEVGQELTVDIRGRAEKAKIVLLPFYTRKN